MSQHVAYKMYSAHDVSIMQEDEHDAENDGPGKTAEDGGDPEDDVLEISTILVAKGGAEDRPETTAETKVTHEVDVADEKRRKKKWARTTT